jgi:hypothetical protein
MKVQKLLYTVMLLTIVGLFSCEIAGDDKDLESLKVPTEIKLSHENTLLQIGDSLQLTHTIIPDTVVITDLVWTSSNTEVATVTGKGMIKTVGLGGAEIKVRSEKEKVEAALYITVIPVPLTKISLEAEIITAFINEPKTLNVLFIPENATNKSLTWKSSDNGILGIDQNGVITAKKLGYVWVSADHSNDVYTSAIIIPAGKDQLVAASQVNSYTHEQKHFINVYLGALQNQAVISEIAVYLGSKGDVNSSLLKTVTPSLTLSPGKTDVVKIEVNAEEANQLTYGRYVRISLTIASKEYYVYLSWFNNFEIEER